MEASVCTTPGYPCETPKNDQCFKFPPELALSVDRIKAKSNFPLHFRSGRSFTPYKNSLLVKSPEVSPIGFTDLSNDHSSIIRLPPEKVCKADADSTIDEKSTNTSIYSNTCVLPPTDTNICLMPPPIRKPCRKSLPLIPMRRRRILPRFREYPNIFERCSQNLSEWRTQKQILDRRIISWLSHYKRHESPMSVDPNNCLSVVSILRGLNLSKYIECLSVEQMDLRVFLSLTDEDLRGIGISDETDRIAILNAINYFEV